MKRVFLFVMILCAAYVQPMYAMIYDFLCIMNFDLGQPMKWMITRFKMY